MNNINKSYYECKRCFYKCYQLIDMKKHLNKKIICKRELKSYDYDEDKLSELSLIRHYNITKNDYENIAYKEYVDKVLKENDFYVDHVEIKEDIEEKFKPLQNRFFEVWKKLEYSVVSK